MKKKEHLHRFHFFTRLLPSFTLLYVLAPYHMGTNTGLSPFFRQLSLLRWDVNAIHTRTQAPCMQSHTLVTVPLHAKASSAVARNPLTW